MSAKPKLEAVQEEKVKMLRVQLQCRGLASQQRLNRHYSSILIKGTVSRTVIH
jgi:hypothetical protein